MSSHLELGGTRVRMVNVRQKLMSTGSNHGFGSGLDPDSIRSVEPDPDSESGSRRGKMTHKSRKKLRSSLWRAEGIFCNFDGGLGTGNL
jgi:hypothetical protein